MGSLLWLFYCCFSFAYLSVTLPFRTKVFDHRLLGALSRVRLTRSGSYISSRINRHRHSSSTSKSFEELHEKARNITLYFGDPLVCKKRIDAWKVIRPDRLFNYDSDTEVISPGIPSESKIERLFDSNAALIMVDNEFQPALSNVDDLERFNITLQTYKRGDHIPQTLFNELSELPEACDGPTRTGNDIIGSEFLAWHNLKQLDSLTVLTIPSNINYGLLEISHWFSHNQLEQKLAKSGRLLVRIGENSTISIVQHLGQFIDGTQGSTENIYMGHTSFSLQPFSNLNHTFSQSLPGSFNGFEIINVSISEYANYTLSSVLVGGSTFRLNAHVDLNGLNASAKMKGVTLGCGRQTHDFRGDIIHHSPSTISDQSYKIVVGNGATAIYKSAINIPATGQYSVASQVCKTLLVNNPCHVHAIPVLRIVAEDVDCKHGVAFADFDQNELFYMLTRGLDQQGARTILLKGFVMNELPDLVKNNQDYVAKISDILNQYDITQWPSKD